MKKINISKFSTVSFMYSDKGKMSALKIENQLEELKEENEALISDLDSIKDAIRAASKISSGETPSEEEKNCLSDLKDNYPTFFDSEGEEDGASSLLNRIMGVKRYLKNEIKSNKKASFKLKKQNDDQDEELSKTESSKRKQAPTSEGQEESSKKNLTSEFIDNLPYNPFDDTGTD